jgi:riboflavin synthase
MFTGIIEELGRVADYKPNAAGGASLRIACTEVLSDAVEGCSIAVNGVCLTALDIAAGSFRADLAPETLQRTNLGALTVGALVNLERALLATGRLSGHIVQGHVDGTAEFLSFDQLGEGNWWLRVKLPQEIDRYVVFKGSICLDGVSLTVAAIEDHIVSVTVIPHTWEATALRTHRPGDAVNVECDVVAKYVEKMLGAERVRPA